MPWVDRDDDLENWRQIDSNPFGQNDKRYIALLQLGTLILLLLVGWVEHLSRVYYLALLSAALFFSYQQWLIRAAA